MELAFDADEFQAKGFSVVRSDNSDPIVELRAWIAKAVTEKYCCPGYPNDFILNNAHQLCNINSDAEANDFVLELIASLTNNTSFAKTAYNSFGTVIEKLLGPDLHSQKGNNIVFQMPGSQRFSELHTDSPPNSEFEIVVWIPLVDCYDTKSFYIVPLAESLRLLSSYNSDSDWIAFRHEAIMCSERVSVPFGNAVIFWTGLLHGSPINTTSESRWAVNVRFKNLFAPCGQHDPLTYYDVFQMSSLTRMGLNL
jgi:sporadic carbohydrate cluster 2OG-Fe(II) oxygenase